MGLFGQAPHRCLPRTSMQMLPLVLLLAAPLFCCPPAHAAAVTPETEARAQKLLQENLYITLSTWRQIIARSGAQKLTMKHFFKTASKFLHSPLLSMWGVKNNRVFQLNKDGELRYSSRMMVQEGRPNRGAAESMKSSLWLAIEDAINHGVQMPDVMFLYNIDDGPFCGIKMNCEDGTYAPPISLMSLDQNMIPQSQIGRARQYPDLLVPVFKNLGYSRQPSIDADPHHPDVLERVGTDAMKWSEKSKIKPDVPWPEKISQLFFRGTRYCPYIPLQVQSICPRLYLSNLTIHYPDRLNMMVNGLPPPMKEELAQHNWTSKRSDAMSEWSKFKYIASIDGLAGSNRVLALFHMGSVVVKQARSPYKEWYYDSIKQGTHYATIFNEGPDGLQNFNDPVNVVDQLRAEDARAHSIAQNGLTFAQTYLTKDVMLVYLRELLSEYKALFEDMDEYIRRFPDTGDSAVFVEHARQWQLEPWKQ